MIEAIEAMLAFCQCRRKDEKDTKSFWQMGDVYMQIVQRTVSSKYRWPRWQSEQENAGISVSKTWLAEKKREKVKANNNRLEARQKYTTGGETPSSDEDQCRPE